MGNNLILNETGFKNRNLKELTKDLVSLASLLRSTLRVIGSNYPRYIEHPACFRVFLGVYQLRPVVSFHVSQLRTRLLRKTRKALVQERVQGALVRCPPAALRSGSNKARGGQNSNSPTSTLCYPTFYNINSFYVSNIIVHSVI